MYGAKSRGRGRRRMSRIFKPPFGDPVTTEAAVWTRMNGAGGTAYETASHIARLGTLGTWTIVKWR